MKKFSKYIFEVLAIFIGITASFLVDEWREEHELSKRLFENLKAIRQELVQDTININQKLALFDSTAATLYQILQRGYVEFSNEREVGRTLNSIVWIGVRAQRSDASFRTLISSPHVNVIRDVDLKLKLSNYYENIRYDILNQEDDHERIAQECEQMILDHCRTSAFGSALNSGSQEQLELAIDNLSDDFNALLKNNSFINRMEIRIQTMQAFADEEELGEKSLPAYKKYVVLLIELIDRELER